MCGRAAKNLCEFITMASIRIIALGDTHGPEKIHRICFSEADLVLTPGGIGEADKLRKYYFDYFFKEEKTPVRGKKSKKPIRDQSIPWKRF